MSFRLRFPKLLVVAAIAAGFGSARAEEILVLPNQIIVPPGEGQAEGGGVEEGKEHPLKRASRLKREELKHFMTLQIDDLKRTCDLNPGQIARLQIASKGAIEKSIEKWVQEIEDNGWIDMVGQMDPDVADQWLASVGENISHKTAARHELWLQTIDSVLTDEQKEKRKHVSADRQAFRREAAVNQAVAILEMELLLSGEQRQRLRALVDEKIGVQLGKRGRAPRQANAYTAELPGDRVREILNEAQIARWEDLEKQGNISDLGLDAQAIGAENFQIDNIIIAE